MPPEESWLSLQVKRQDEPASSSKTIVHISVPKKIVRLATERNRIKRLIKEALRGDSQFGDARAIYHFRVRRKPGAPNLRSVQKELKRLQP